MTISTQRMTADRLVSILRLCADDPAKHALEYLERLLEDDYQLDRIAGVLVRSESSPMFGQVEIWRLSAQCSRGPLYARQIECIEWETSPNMIVHHIRRGGS